MAYQIEILSTLNWRLFIDETEYQSYLKAFCSIIKQANEQARLQMETSMMAEKQENNHCR